MTTLYIKNMVCNRCIMVVENELGKLGLKTKYVRLGEAALENELSVTEREKLKDILISLGFALIDDKKGKIIEKIKNTIIPLGH